MAPWRTRCSARSRLWFDGLLLIALPVVFLIDRPVFRFFRGDASALETHDWYRLLRVLGYLPTWLLVGAALTLVDLAPQSPPCEPRRRWRGGLVVLSATGSGLAAEVLKLIVRRERPGPDGQVVYKPWTHLLDSSNLGMPSSHTAVAFGATLMLTWFHPRASLVLIPAAAGCALTRLLAGAHLPSDVYVGALLGLVVSRLTWSVAGGRGADLR